MSKHVPASVECQIGGRTFKLETGKIAKLASGAVVATYGDTVVLATAVRAAPRLGIDFFPLTCDTVRSIQRLVVFQAVSARKKALLRRRKCSQ